MCVKPWVQSAVPPTKKANSNNADVIHSGPIGLNSLD